MGDEDWWFGDKHSGRILLLAEGSFRWQLLADSLNSDCLKATQLLRKNINLNVEDQYLMKRVDYVVADTPGKWQAVQMFARGIVLPEGVVNETKTPSLTVKKDDEPGEVLERLKAILRRPDKWGPIHAYLRGGRLWR